MTVICGCERKIVCTTYVPSLVASVFSSRRKNIPEFTNFAPATLSAAAFASSSSATFSSIGTSNGSISAGPRQVPFAVGVTGASTTGRSSAARFAMRLRDGLLGDAHHLIGGEIAAGGESPRSLHEHAHAETEGLGVA